MLFAEKIMNYKIFIVFLAISVVNCEDDTPPLIKTPLGAVQGVFKESYQGRIYSSFEGIPYAKPPIGNLRFSEPQPVEKWNDVLVANRSYICKCYLPFPGLHGIQGSEDCLYVYVYTPLKNITGEENLDVVVHIHGGGFMIGAPSYMAGPNYIMDKDVVFVTMNYRLAILGFLSTEDNEVPGNNGLKDQVMALKWIKDNIKYFGGNPDSITLTGLSAGAASVHYHYLSPMSKGLFHKGFSQSGTVLQSWSLIENPLSKAKLVSEHLNCSINSTKIMVECLRDVDANKLINAMTKLFIYLNSIPFIVFGPVIEKGENPFLSEHPYKMMKEGKIYDVPWIVSNVKDEGLFPTAFFVLAHKMNEFESKWNEIMPYTLDIYDTVDKSKQLEVVKKIREYYYEDEPVNEENAYCMVHMLNDRFYFIDTEKAIRLQAKSNKSPVYYYFFTYLLTHPLLSSFGIKRGVGHGDDGSLLYKMFGVGVKLDPADEEMMKIFIGFLAGYAKTGIPTINDVEWKPIAPGSQSLNVLKVESPNEISMIQMEKLGKTEFWNNLSIIENEKLFL